MLRASLLLLLLLCGAAPATRPTLEAMRIAAQIEALGDPSVEQRDLAVQNLTTIGRPARDALLQAAHGAAAQRRQLAKLVLARLPLFDDNDPPPLRAMLQDYGEVEPPRRAVVALRFATHRTPMTDAAIDRVLREESNADVLWAIARDLAVVDAQRLVAGPLATLNDPASLDLVTPPLHYIMGVGAATASERLAAFHECLTTLTAVTAAAAPVVTRVANALCEAARLQHDNDGELDARRRLALLLSEAPPVPGVRRARAMDGEDVDVMPVDPLSPAVEAYLATRVRLHSLDSVEDDLASMGVQPAHPLAQFMLGALHHDLSIPATKPADAGAELAPELAALVDALSPLDVPDALLLLCAAERWSLVGQIAERERVKLDANANDPVTPYRRVRVELIRRRAALARNDSIRAADALIAARSVPMDERRRIVRGEIMMTLGDRFAERYIAAVRRAMAADDALGLEFALDSLARVSVSDSMLAIDAIYVMELNGRFVEADEVAAEYLYDIRAQLDLDPNDPISLNRVAWFCARTGRNLEQAYALAKRANEPRPAEPGLMDTWAEAAFRTNRVEEAVRLESMALRMNDRMGGGMDDLFIAYQLERFRAGCGENDARRAMPSENWLD